MKSFQFFRLKVTNVAIAELADRGRHWNVRKRNVREQNIWDRNVPDISLLGRNLWGRKIAEKKFRSAFWCKSFIKSFYSPFHQCETGCCWHCRIRNIWASLFLCWSAFIAVGFYPGGTQRKHYCFFVEFFSLCCWAFNVGFYPRLTQTLLGFNTERDDRTLQPPARPDIFFLAGFCYLFSGIVIVIICSIQRGGHCRQARQFFSAGFFYLFSVNTIVVICSVLLLLLLFVQHKEEDTAVRPDRFLSVVYRRKQTRKRRHIKKYFSANSCRSAPKLFRLGQNWNLAVWVEK